MKRYEILTGDCLERLAELPDNSVDSIVTDPPYGLGFMGKKWDIGVPAVEVFVEALRVIKPGGHLLAFGGSRTYHRLAVAVEDGGFEIRDQIMWVYGSGFPKSRNVGKEVDGWDGWGTALKPAHEPIVVARKPLTGTVAANVLEHGTGALNIDGCRVATDENLNGGAYAKNGGRSESQSLHAGSGMNQPGKTTGRDFEQPAGRFPANLIHDGSAEVLAMFPDAKGQQGASCDAQRTRQNTYGALSDNGKADVPRIDSTASAARFFYCAKASKRDRNAGCEGIEATHTDDQNKLHGAIQYRNICRLCQRVLKNAVTECCGASPERIPSERAKRSNHHPTVKPTDLMRYLCRLVTPPGGTVLDFFAGSGSTGKAALLEGFAFIGIEKEAEYLPIIRARLDHAASVDPDREGQLDLMEVLP